MSSTSGEWKNITTPRGNNAAFWLRDGTNDGALVTAVAELDEYKTGSLPPLEGWALDIGAHVGSVSIMLALDNPGLKVIAVEAVPENAESISRAVVQNELRGRVFVVNAAAGAPGQATATVTYGYTSVEGIEDEHARQNKYVGNVFRSGGDVQATDHEIPVVTLRGLAAEYGVESFRYAKTDCEGGEWQFFSDGAELVEEIVGEAHDRPVEAVFDLFSPTHDVEILVWAPVNGPGIFHAVRK